MLAALLLQLAAVHTPEPPTTVNGQVLGEAEEFATTGPAQVCLKDMIVSPEPGETVYVEYLGIHDARLRLVLADGTYALLSQGDAFLDRRLPDQLPAMQKPGQAYYLIRDDDGSSLYQMVRSDDLDQLLFISGTALAGTSVDEALFARLSFAAEPGEQCDRRLGYGWDGIFWTRPAEGEAE